MADITWPVDLPQRLSWVNFQESPPNTVVRSQMDSGPDKIRRRYTAGVRSCNGGFEALTAAQIAILDTFFGDTTGGGALRFNWVHPRTGDVAELRFKAPPQYTGVGGLSFDVQLQLEVLP